MAGHGTRIPPPVYFLVGLFAMWGLDRFLPLVHWGGDLARRLALVPVTAGGLFGLAGVAHFVRAGTPVEPFHEARAFVSGGVYRLTRNPMYLGLALILAGAFLRFGSLSPAVVPPLFVIVVTRRVIAFEEAMLEKKYGDVYRRYTSRVRRWI